MFGFCLYFVALLFGVVVDIAVLGVVLALVGSWIGDMLDCFSIAILAVVLLFNCI